MSPIFRRRFAVALVVMLCTAVFTLTWVAGWLLSLFLLGIGIVCVAAVFGVCRFLPGLDTEADRMARGEARLRHPAGRARITNPADAAPLVPQEPAAAVAEPDGDLLATRRGWLNADEIYDLLATTDLRHWWEWTDSMPSKTRKLSAKLYRRNLKAQRRGQR